MFLGKLSLEDAKQKIEEGTAKLTDFFFACCPNTPELQEDAEELYLRLNKFIKLCEIDISRIRVEFRFYLPIEGDPFSRIFITSIKCSDDFIILTPLMKSYDDNFLKTRIFINNRNEQLIYGSWRNMAAYLEIIKVKIGLGQYTFEGYPEQKYKSNKSFKVYYDYKQVAGLDILETREGCILLESVTVDKSERRKGHLRNIIRFLKDIQKVEVYCLPLVPEIFTKLDFIPVEVDNMPMRLKMGLDRNADEELVEKYYYLPNPQPIEPTIIDFGDMKQVEHLMRCLEQY